MTGRLYLTGAVLLVEYIAIVSAPHPWSYLHRVVSGAIVFTAVFLFLSHRKLENQPVGNVNHWLLALYPVCLGVIAWAHMTLLAARGQQPAVVNIWFAAIAASGLVLFFGLIPFSKLPTLFRQSRSALAYAGVATVGVVSLSDRVQLIWNAPSSWGGIFLQRSTLRLVRSVLALFYGNVSVDPAAYSVTLPHFEVMIAGSCAGVEGLSLILLFTGGWLWYARKQLQFPRALLLVPCAMVLMYGFNILRIVALLSIGNAGYPDIAIHGFHSEAGWIAFNIVALVVLTIANRLKWLQNGAALGKQPNGRTAAPADAAHRNAAAIYLLPFLALLVAASVSRAASGGFEWLYPLRLFVTAAVLWLYRKEYGRMDWSFSWRGVATGALVFAMWLACSHWTGPRSRPEIAAGLASMSPAIRVLWLTLRMAAAVITVPIAEELAFRGFLLRRLASTDVERVSYAHVGPVAILISSLAFGLMHGKLWFAGVIAGVAYSVVLKRTGRLGEAVAAHSATNLLLAGWVIVRGDWGLW